MKKYDWLCIRLGYEVLWKNIRDAITESGIHSSQVSVDYPWEHPSNVILADTLQQIANTQNVLAKSSTDAVKVLNRVATEFRGNITTVSSALEYEIGRAVARFLENGQIIKCSYKYAEVIQSTPGDY